MLLLASIVDIGGYMLQVIKVLQKRFSNRMHQPFIIAFLLSLLLLLLFVSTLLTRAVILRSWGMTYVGFKQKYSRNRDADDEIVIYIP